MLTNLSILNISSYLSVTMMCLKTLPDSILIGNFCYHTKKMVKFLTSGYTTWIHTNALRQRKVNKTTISSPEDKAIMVSRRFKDP